MRWVAVSLLLHDVEESVKEISGAKDNGAVGYFSAASKASGRWTIQYFYPIYQVANDLDLPILIHTGAGCPLFLKLFDVEPALRPQPRAAAVCIQGSRSPTRFPSGSPSSSLVSSRLRPVGFHS